MLNSDEKNKTEKNEFLIDSLKKERSFKSISIGQPIEQ